MEDQSNVKEVGLEKKWIKVSDSTLQIIKQHQEDHIPKIVLLSGDHIPQILPPVTYLLTLNGSVSELG